MFKKIIKGLTDVWCGSLEFDTTPKAGSYNPVTSSGVKEAINEVVSDIHSIETAIPEGAGEEDQLVKSSELNAVDVRLENVESKIPSSASSTDKLVTKSELDNATASMESGYTPKGPASVSTLNGLTGQENGDQYIVTDSGTLTEGSLAVTAGESVAWDSVNEKWYKVNQYALKSVQVNIMESFAPAFDPNKVGGYAKYELVVFNGTNYMFKNPHSGEWNASDVVEIPCSFFLNRVLGSNGVETYSGTIEGGANYELIKSVYKSGDVIKVSIQSSQRVNFVGVNLNDESVIIREYASNNVNSSFQYVLQQDFKSFGLYVYGSSSSEVSLKLDTTLGVRIDAVNAAMQQCLTRNNIEPYSIAVTTGSYISASDGVAGYSANGRCSDYVRVQPGDKIKVKCYLDNSGAKVACYDTDKKYIAESSLITDGSYNGYFVIPSGVAYIRCSAYVSSGAAEPIFDNLPTTNLVDNIGNYYLKTSDYIATQFNLINGAYLDASTGGLSSSSGGRYTEYAEVSEGDRFYIKCYLTTGGAKVACYDENKQYLQNESLITDGSYNGYFVIPSGVRYIRFSAYVSSSASEPIFESVPKKSFSPKNDNLKLLVFGDSISEDFYYTISQEGYTTAVTPSTRKAWSYRSNLVLNFAELRNYAKSGASYKNQSFGEWNRLSISEQVLIAINDKTDPGNVWGDGNFVPDVIVFAAGTNDGAPNDTPESALAKIVYDEDGSVDTAATLSALNLAKFCEAVMWSMLKIRIEYPYALGLCVLPIQRCSSDVNFGNLNTYLTTMARRYGFIPIDGISECGIIKDNNKKGAQGATLDDGLHPNIQGNRMMARMMIQAIDRYYYPTSKL